MFPCDGGDERGYLPREASLASETSNSDESSNLAILRGVLGRGVIVYCDVSAAIGLV